MKNLAGIIILAVVCVGLVVALLLSRNKAVGEKRKDVGTILFHSNKWENTRAELDEHKQVIQNLEKDIDVRKEQFTQLTNRFADVSTALNKTENSLKASQEEVAKRDAKIADLESQNAALDQRAIDLSVSITNLTMQIAETERRLATTEGDKAFLEKELQRLIGEKAELERQFNDLTVLRAQVAKLKEELNVARRLDWIRKGLFTSADQKGAQLLLNKTPPPSSAQKPGAYDLNVEVSADGSLKVIPPLTNRPGTTP